MEHLLFGQVSFQTSIKDGLKYFVNFLWLLVPVPEEFFKIDIEDDFSPFFWLHYGLQSSNKQQNQNLKEKNIIKLKVIFL